MLEVTVRFASWAEMIAFAQANAGRIAPADVPSVGAPEAPVAPVAAPAPAPVDPAAVFGATPAAPVAVVNPPPAPAAATGAPELDANSLPWDARIHGANRTKNADGTWRQKRGLKEDDPNGTMRAQVEAELRAGLAVAPAPTPVAPAMPPEYLKTLGPGVVVPITPPAPPAPPAAVVVPPAPVAPVAPPAAAQWSFARLLTAVSAGGPAGIAKALETISQFGPKSMPELAAASTADPTLCGTVALALGLS